MLTTHPYLAVMHIFDGKREAPKLSKRTEEQ
jgi:hypothetical protein